MHTLRLVKASLQTALLLLAVVVLTCVMVASVAISEPRTSVWKSSVPPVFYKGLVQEKQQSGTTHKGLEDLLRTSKPDHVKIGGDGDGLDIFGQKGAQLPRIDDI